MDRLILTFLFIISTLTVIGSNYISGHEIIRMVLNKADELEINFNFPVSTALYCAFYYEILLSWSQKRRLNFSIRYLLEVLKQFLNIRDILKLSLNNK